MTDEEVAKLISTIELKSMYYGADEMWGKALQLIWELQAENATLQERLEKAVELPCKIGDIVYKVHDRCNGKACPYNGDYGQWRCHYEGKQRCEPFVETIQFCYGNIPQIGKTIFISKEEAESRLAELKGDK